MKKRQIKTLPEAQLGQTLPWFCLAKGEKYMEQLKEIHVSFLTNPVSWYTLNPLSLSNTQSDLVMCEVSGGCYAQEMSCSDKPEPTETNRVHCASRHHIIVVPS